MNRTPTYTFAKYVYGEQFYKPLTKESIENRRWFLYLSDKQLEEFFTSCHNEWRLVLEKYLGYLCDRYANPPAGKGKVSVKNKLQELYAKSIKIQPKLSVRVMDRVTPDEFPNWAARIYISTMFGGWDEVRLGKLILTFTGILYLKQLLELQE